MGAALDQYAPAERQSIDGETRYVRLVDEPISCGDVLPWLVDNGYVKRTRINDPDDGETWQHHGWGTTYFAVPFERTVAR